MARGSALVWLAEHGLLAESEPYDPCDLDSFARLLTCRLVSSGPDRMVATLGLAGDDAAQLRQVGETHPSKVVAKAVRKALRSRKAFSGPPARRSTCIWCHSAR